MKVTLLITQTNQQCFYIDILNVHLEWQLQNCYLGIYANFVISNLSVRHVGVVGEYLPASIGSNCWLDTSGNEDHGTSTEESPAIKFSGAGQYGVGLTVKSPYGCVNSDFNNNLIDC